MFEKKEKWKYKFEYSNLYDEAASTTHFNMMVKTKNICM